MANNKLQELMQSLPSELFNGIYALVFTHTEIQCAIDKGYKPPVQLQIDRASREALAKIYYSNTTFTTSDDPTRSRRFRSLSSHRTTFVLPEHRLGSRWLRSVPRDHMERIRYIYQPYGESSAALENDGTLDRRVAMYAALTAFAHMLAELGTGTR